MPILKPTVVKNAQGESVSGNYWVIPSIPTGIYLSSDNRGVRGFINLYENQAAYVSGATALDQETFELVDSQNPLGFGALRNLVEQGLIANDPTFVSGSQV